MNTKQKKMLARIVIAAVLFATAIIVGIFINNDYLRIGMFVLSFVIVGADVIIKAFKNLFKGRIMDENFLMSVATIGAFILSDYLEAVAVMLFYRVGELFENIAVSRSRNSIKELMNIRPDTANLKRDGQVILVSPEEVNCGDVIVVKPGERIPIDGVVINGNASVDTSALTGESLPKDCSSGEEVLSGSVCLNGILEIRTTTEFENSTVSKILELVTTAEQNKSRSENFITRFAAIYTPCVVIAATLLAVVPPLLSLGSFSMWIERALIFLVISCPCALVISVPLGFFGGIGGASRQGIIIKGSNYLEALSKLNTAVFDKTGTLTTGTFSVLNVCENGVEKDYLLSIAAACESFSSHPIALSLKKAAKSKEVVKYKVNLISEQAGFGIIARVDEKIVTVGTLRLASDNSKNIVENRDIGTCVYVTEDSKFIGSITVGDAEKKGSAEAIAQLKRAGIKTVMLTGDRKSVADSAADRLGIDKSYSELLPGDKVELIETLLAKTKGKLAFVGDGINDAPALARADVGIAMGGLGSDAAVEAADIVIMDDDPRKVFTSIKIAKRTMNIVRQNIVFSLLIKALVLILGTIGAAGMWVAVFADIGVSIIAILNSMRGLYSIIR